MRKLDTECRIRGYTFIQYIEDIQDTVINRKLYEKRDNIISILKCN